MLSNVVVKQPGLRSRRRLLAALLSMFLVMGLFVVSGGQSPAAADTSYSKTSGWAKANGVNTYCYTRVYVFRTYSSSKGHRVGTYQSAYCHERKSTSSPRKKVMQINLYATMSGYGGVTGRYGICDMASSCRTSTQYRKNPSGSQKFCSGGSAIYNYASHSNHAIGPLCKNF